MNWINFYGLAFMLVIMIPNIIFASINKDGFQNLWKNKFVEVLEQIVEWLFWLYGIYNPEMWIWLFAR